MKYLLIFAFLIIPQAFAITTDCGTYIAHGVIREIQDDFALLINEKSQSEFSVVFPDSELLKLTPYIDEPVAIEFEIDQKQRTYILSAQKITKIGARIPSPLMAKDTFLKAKKTRKCLLN